MVILRTAIFFEEVRFEKLQTAAEVFVPRLVTSAVDVALQAVEIITRVKVISDREILSGR